MRLTASPGIIVYKKKLDFWSYFQLKFEIFSKSLLFRILKLFQNPAILLIYYFKKNPVTSIQENYIYFMKTTNEWVVFDIRFRD